MSNSLLPRQQLVEPALLAFLAAAKAIEQGKVRMAIGLLAAIDDQPLRDHFEAAGREWSRRHAAASARPEPSVEASLRDTRRLPTGARQVRFFNRDGWHCRWCNSPVLSLRAVKRMHQAVGPAFPHGSTNESRHGLTLAAGSSLDHVVPHSLGGQNTETNLVTACWPCQFGRGNDSIGRLGIAPPSNPPVGPALPGWDGCDWFR